MINRRSSWLVAAAITFALASGSAFAGAQRVENAIWGDGVLFDTVLTPTSFNVAPSHTVDKLYNFSMSGLTGQHSVSEAVPGDRDFNGGRWWVQMVVFTEQGLETFDPDGDGSVNFELQNDADVLTHASLGDLEIYPTGTYFECPMLPSR